MNFSKGKESIQDSAKNLALEPETEKNAHCRICLSQGNSSEEQKNNLISPCLCKGSLQYVHINCIFAWIKQNWKESQMNGGVHETNCEICRTKMTYEIQLKYSFRTCEQIQEEIKKEVFKFVVGLLFLLGFFVLFGFIITALTTKIDFDQTFLILIIIIAFVLIAVLVCCLVKKFFSKQEINLLSIHTKE